MFIAFSTNPKNIFSTLLRKVTHSKSSHSFLTFNSYGEELLIEAGAKGIAIDIEEKFLKNNIILAKYHLNLTTEDETKIMHFALSQLDDKYAWWNLIGMGWVMLNRTFNRYVKNPIVGKNSYVCSQFVIKCLEQIDYEYTRHLDSDSATPQDVIESLSKDPNAVLIESINNSK